MAYAKSSGPTPGAPTESARLSGFGRTQSFEVLRSAPQSVADIAAIFERARANGRPVCLRGSGRSYGDPAVLAGGEVLDLRQMNRVLGFDKETSIIHVEPGVTIEGLWRNGLPRAHWPKVVSGTMYPTIGGAAAMNIHGKNAFRVGTIGRHIQRFGLLTPSGDHLSVSRESDPLLFKAALGGFGMLGAFTDLELRMQPVETGFLRVQPRSTGSIAEMTTFLDAEKDRSDYLVGWVDIIGGGRGLVHQAWYAKKEELEGQDLAFAAKAQELPSTILHIVPKSWLWPFLWLALNPLGMRFVNGLKHWAGQRESKHPSFLQPLVAFSFLLDYVPRWEWAYLPGGLVQYQSFVPKETATATFEALIRTTKEFGIPPYLGVMKRHQSEDFLLSHAVDGYSLAMDFQVPRGGKRQRFEALTARMDEIVIAAGGRFYFAKDATLKRESVAKIWPAAELQAFQELKERLDPNRLLQSELSRRLFG